MVIQGQAKKNQQRKQNASLTSMVFCCGFNFMFGFNFCFYLFLDKVV